MFQLCFNLNRIHDSVEKALRTADQDRVTDNSHALSSSFDLWTLASRTTTHSKDSHELSSSGSICLCTIDILYTLDSASLLVKLKPRIFQRLPPFE